MKRANRLPRAGSDNLASVRERGGNLCHLCVTYVSKDQASRDHVVPRASGGDDHRTNYRIAHKQCNTARGDLPLDRAYAVIRAYRESHPIFDRTAVFTEPLGSRYPGRQSYGALVPMTSINPSLCAQLLNAELKVWRAEQLEVTA